MEFFQKCFPWQDLDYTHTTFFLFGANDNRAAWMVLPNKGMQVARVNPSRPLYFHGNVAPPRMKSTSCPDFVRQK